MTKEVNRPKPGSFAPSAIIPQRLPPQQRWDRRYAQDSPVARSEPAPFVVRCLRRLPRQGRALDIAAGAGRHTLVLAEWGLQVDAVDISSQGVHVARQRMRQAGFESGQQTQFIVADVERPWLPHRLYDVILATFFLHRPLFPLLKTRLAPGGWLLYETLTVDQESTPENNQPIRRRFLLEPDELRTTFSDFEILFYDEGEHHGKETAQLLARKPHPVGA
jgi:SAM-dependent methyltransferase